MYFKIVNFEGTNQCFNFLCLFKIDECLRLTFVIYLFLYYEILRRHRIIWKMVLEISVDNIKIEQNYRKICQRIILTK